jgi:hypothetical protein
LGYSTEFKGSFKLNKKLDKETLTFLQKFNESRRVARNVDPEYGIEGELYVDGSDDFDESMDKNIIDYNRPPKTQPSLWCQWRPNNAGTAIEWDGNEKFYCYKEWIAYLIRTVLSPKGYYLTGVVTWQGEDDDDKGRILIDRSFVTVKNGETTRYDSGNFAESEPVPSVKQDDCKRRAFDFN